MLFEINHQKMRKVKYSTILFANLNPNFSLPALGWRILYFGWSQAYVWNCCCRVNPQYRSRAGAGARAIGVSGL
jgi:hypothetical protein